MHLTYLDSNSWLIELGGQRILLDPWLVGKLVFGNLPWLFQGSKQTSRPIPENIDLILLSQGLEDHAHPPTLEVLDHSLPVVASPNGAKVAQDLGYSQVKALEHGQSFSLNEKVEIQALPGSPIGPMLTENGYLLKDLEQGTSIYYEPHGYHHPSLQKMAPVDVIIAPIVGLKIPLLGAVIKGNESALQACQWLKPQVILPTAAGGDIDFKGLLMSVLREEGSMEQFNSLLAKNGLGTQVIEPQPGERLALNLKQRIAT